MIGVLVLLSAEELKKNDLNVMFYNNLKQYLGAEIVRKQQEEGTQSLFPKNAPEILAIATSKRQICKSKTLPLQIYLDIRKMS